MLAIIYFLSRLPSSAAFVYIAINVLTDVKLMQTNYCGLCNRSKTCLLLAVASLHVNINCSCQSCVTVFCLNCVSSAIFYHQSRCSLLAEWHNLTYLVLNTNQSINQSLLLAWLKHYQLCELVKYCVQPLQSIREVYVTLSY